MDLILTTPHFSRVAGNVGIGETGDDRRRSERFPLRCRVVVGLPGNQIFRGHTVDISETGLSIIIPAAINAGQTCRVLFTVVAPDGVVEITGNGKIANCACTKEGFRIGMTFEGSNDESKQAIFKIVNDRNTR